MKKYLTLLVICCVASISFAQQKIPCSKSYKLRWGELDSVYEVCNDTMYFPDFPPVELVRYDGTTFPVKGFEMVVIRARQDPHIIKSPDNQFTDEMKQVMNKLYLNKNDAIIIRLNVSLTFTDDNGKCHMVMGIGYGCPVQGE